MTKLIECLYLKRKAEALNRAPWPGALGQKILDNISKEAWNIWIQHQTMLINENRLNLIDQSARDFLANEMEKFFFPKKNKQNEDKQNL